MQGDTQIGYDMIIGHDLMVQLGPKADFGCKILEWDEPVIPMREPGNFLGKPNLTKRDTQEMVMQTLEPYYTI